MQDRLLLRGMSALRRHGQHQGRKHQRGNPAHWPKDFHSTSPDTKKNRNEYKFARRQKGGLYQAASEDLEPLHSSKKPEHVRRSALRPPAARWPQPARTI